MGKWFVRGCLGICLLAVNSSLADDATQQALATLGDQELIEEYLHEHGIPNIYDNCRSPLSSDFTETGDGGQGDGGQGGECPPEGRTCFYNDPKNPTYDPDGDGVGTPTTDKCIIGKKGNECEDGKCCEFEKKNADGSPDTSSCKCITDSSGECKTSSDCAECTCDAEARAETPACKKMVLCALKNRAKKHTKPNTKPEDHFCDVLLYQSQNSDVPQISSKKCICDRSKGDGDERGTNPGTGNSDYNQFYCECCAFKKANPGKVFNAECAAQLANLDCSSGSYARVNSFRGKKLKKPANCTEVPAPRGATCGHRFYTCPYNP